MEAGELAKPLIRLALPSDGREPNEINGFVSFEHLKLIIEAYGVF